MDVTQRRISIIARGVGRFTTRTMRREGIGASEFDLIQAVRCHPGITQAEVCQRLEIDKGAAARQFARLEAKGYLRRETNPADRRSRLLYATHKAEELKNSKAHLEELFYEWLLEPLNAQEQEELARLLAVLEPALPQRMAGWFSQRRGETRRGKGAGAGRQSGMRMIFRYMKAYARRIASSMTVKLLGAVTELLIPYILEHLIDEVVPLGQMRQVILWGLLMVATALVTRQLNVWANRMAIDNAHNVSYDIRQDLFTRTANLSGAQFDAFGLPSLISRMTSDSYNVQSCVQTLQTLCVRVPMMLLGGICVTLMMDAALSAILCVMVPVLIVVILCVSRYGIPLYRKVQERLDDVVRVMREDISGIRVVKALSKTEYESGASASNEP